MSNLSIAIAAEAHYRMTARKIGFRTDNTRHRKGWAPYVIGIVTGAIA